MDGSHVDPSPPMGNESAQFTSEFYQLSKSPIGEGDKTRHEYVDMESDQVLLSSPMGETMQIKSGFNLENEKIAEHR